MTPLDNIKRDRGYTFQDDCYSPNHNESYK